MTNSTENHWKLTWMIRLASLVRIPLLGVCFPRIKTLNSQSAEVQLNRWWLTGNHVGSMYFGALAMGAELSIATRLIQRLYKEKLPLSFIFKDASFQFLSRAEDHVIFRCDEVPQADQLIERSLATADRCEHSFHGYAYCQSNPDKRTLEYEITLSVKNTGRGKKNMMASALVMLVAIQHLFFLVLEMFLWTKPLGLKIFRQSLEKAEAQKVLAANQGLYNGFLAAGLLWGLVHPDRLTGFQIQIFFLGCVFIAGVFGGQTFSKKIFYVQSLPALAAIGLLWFGI